jgi:hypothetical protein
MRTLYAENLRTRVEAMPLSQAFKIVRQPIFDEQGGRLFAVQHGQYELFDFRRVLFIEGVSGSKRGEHAHKACSQWLCVLTGKVKITLKDGAEEHSLALTGFGEIVIVNPGLWVELDFLEPGVVAAGADELYDENDYIRNWAEFLRFRGIN